MAYRCQGGACEEDRLGETPVSESPSPRPQRRRVKVFELRLSLSGYAPELLSLTASPQENETVTAVLWTRAKGCPLEVMVDGQRLDLPAVADDRPAVALSRAFVRDLGSAQQMAVRHCDMRWSLDVEQLSDVRHFVARYEEELAWNDPPRNSPSGGHKPPSGGWKPWQGLDARPRATTGSALPPPVLFQKLSPSVVRVEATVPDGISQGSGVAVSPSLVATNCHVIEGATKFSVKQLNTSFSAVLAQSDPIGDRCILEVSPANLTPISGVRSYAELTVGEPLYTLGNPSGLDLSIAGGMLSGLRRDEGRPYVQTSAPISPGSSGGGLFDNQGNLVGITTLVLAGKERLNQSLNFAIAAEMFWQP
jgi:hypothetical protein